MGSIGLIFKKNNKSANKGKEWVHKKSPGKNELSNRVNGP